MDEQVDRDLTPVASAQSIALLIRAVESLPLPPTSVHPQLLTLSLEDPELPEKAQMIIARDPMLVGHAIGLANSSAYAGSEAVTKLSEAISRVGPRTIVRSILRIVLSQVFQSSTESGRRLAAIALLEANLLMSLAASSVDSTPIVPEEAYVVGILHDIGQSVMAFIAPRAFEMFQHRTIEPERLIAAEHATFGFDHQTAGRLLCNYWKLPRTLTLIIASHHLPPECRPECDARESRLVDLTNLADRLSRALAGAEKDKDVLERRISESLHDPAVEPLLGRLSLTVDLARAAAFAALVGARRDESLSRPGKNREPKR